MTKKEKIARAAAITDALKELYPDAECALQYGGDPWRLLVMGRLSAQCTDTLWSSTEQHDDTVLMLFSLDVQGVKMYGSAFMLLRVSRADADALLEALRLCNYLKEQK